MKKFLNLFLLIGTLLINCCSSVAFATIAVKDSIPNFSINDLNGNTFFIEDYFGENKKVKNNGIIFTFCATWSKYTLNEVLELEKIYIKNIQQIMF